MPAQPRITEGSSATKRVKCSSVIDQADETDIKHLTPSELAGVFQSHIDTVGAEPLEECLPSSEHISVLRGRVVGRGEGPYANFSSLTPFGRRVQKLLRLRSWFLQQDGTYKPIDVPGPPGFESWYACFRVFCAVLLMLRYPSGRCVMKLASIEAYFEAFRKLASLHPESCHLCATAEDRCRGEHFAQLRRDLMRASASGPGSSVLFGVEFDPECPWDALFFEASRDDRFWDAEVRRPAISFLARRSFASCPMVSAAAQEAITNIALAARGTRDTGQGMSAGGLLCQGGAGRGTSKTPARNENSEVYWRHLRVQERGLDPFRLQKKSFRGLSARKWGCTPRNGVPSFKRFGRQSSCVSPGRKVLIARTHVPTLGFTCQYCLGSHSNKDCRNRKIGNDSKGKGSGKGRGGRS